MTVHVLSENSDKDDVKNPPKQGRETKTHLILKLDALRYITSYATATSADGDREQAVLFQTRHPFKDVHAP